MVSIRLRFGIATHTRMRTTNVRLVVVCLFTVQTTQVYMAGARMARNAGVNCSHEVTLEIVLFGPN